MSNSSQPTPEAVAPDSDPGETPPRARRRSLMPIITGNWPIRQRMLILVVLGAVMFGLGLAIHLLGTMFDRQVKDTERRYLAFVEDTRAIELSILRLRASVEDLASKQDPAAARRADAAAGDALTQADQLALGDIYSLFGDRILEVGVHTKAIGRPLEKVTDFTLKLGLDDQSGLRGSLRRAISAVEQALAVWPLDAVKVKLQEAQRFEYAYLLWRKDDDIGRFRKAANELDFAIFASTIPADERAKLSALIDAYAKALFAFSEVAAEQHAARRELDSVVDKALAAVTAIRERSLIALGEASARQEQVGRTISTALYTAAGFTLVAFVLLAFWIARSIYEPVLHIDEAMRRVAAGESELEIPGIERQDEIGAMARSIVKFRDALREVERIRAAEAKRSDELKLLAIAQAISSELSIDTLLGMIADATSDLLSSERTSLFLYDQKSDTLFTRVAQGLSLSEIRIPTTAGLAGACFTKGAPINIQDAQNDPRFNKDVDRKTGYHTRNILCMPVTTKEGRRVGVLQVLNRKDGPFTEMDERRLSAFASQVAITLENARLFEDVITIKNYNESILKSLSNGVVTLDSDGGVVKLNDAAARLLGLERAEPVGPIGLLLPEDAWVEQAIAKVRRTGEPDITVDQEIRPIDRPPVSVNLNVAPLIDVNGEQIGTMLVFEDISAEKRVKSTMARYISKDVLDKLLESGESVLGGVSQEVTVMFSDVRSFTTLTEALGPRGTVELLNGYFTEMVDILISRGGTLDKYIGDAMMMLFGAPLMSGNDADNAISAACDMMLALDRMNGSRRVAGWPSIEIGLGIATGEVVAGNIGSPKRMEYTVIGDSVNLASRLEGATKQYGTRILFDDRTRARLLQKVRMREVDLIRVKGKTQPVCVYEALGFHDDESFPRLDAFLPLHNAGLAFYRARHFADAESLFGEAAILAPQDRLNGIYRDRSRHYLSVPPPDDWDGVFTMTEK